jgi:hypothetical protein
MLIKYPLGRILDRDRSVKVAEHHIII